jgi:tetratricopeptide (TPR) repeat protein
MEYHYMQGDFRPYLPTDQLSLRIISSEMVNAELARRAIEQSPSERYMYTMERQALEYLNEGRRDAAAGIFEAARILEPQNALAHNNYGFCLLPDHPMDALKAFRQAEGLRGPNVVTSINQAVGHWLLGEHDDALRVVKEAYARGRGDEDEAYLWNYFDGEDEVAVTLFDVTDYLCRFGLKVAKQEKDADAIKTWMARVSELPPESAT